MTVVVIERHRRPIVSVRLVFPEGVAQEAPIRAGVTNLAYSLLAEVHEHGEDGARLYSEKSLRRQFVDIGGQYRSVVAHDYAAIGVDGYAADLPKYLELLAGGITRPRAGEQTFEGYRRAMLDHIDELEVSDADVVDQVLAQASFGAQHPYARPIYGTQDSLTNLSLEEVRAEQRRVLRPGRATLIVVGDVKPEGVLRSAQTAFDAWTSRAANQPIVPVPPPEATPRTAVQVLTRAPASTTLVCATRALGDLPLDDAAPDVLAHILGDGVTSRMAVLREKHGWTYSPSAQLVRRKHGRSLLACARLDATATSDGVRVLLEVLADLRVRGPTAEEIASAREVLRSRALAGVDEVRGAMAQAVERLVYGYGADERAQKLDALTAERVREVATRVLDPARIHWVMLGSVAETRAAAAANGLGPVNTTRMGDMGVVR